MEPLTLHSEIAKGCFEIMEHGTRNARRQKNVPSGLRFNICKLKSSYLEDSKVSDIDMRIRENISPELLYGCTHWFDHVNRAQSQGVSSSWERIDFGLRVQKILCSTRSLFLIEVMNLCARLQAVRGALLRIDSLQLVSALDFCKREPD